MSVEAPPPPILTRNVRVVTPELTSDSRTSGVEPRLFRFELKETPAPWLDSAIEQIAELTRLQPNWDGYGSPPVSGRAAIEAAQFVLHTAYPEIQPPDVIPAPDGLQLEWHHEDVDIEVIFTKDGSKAYIEDHVTGESREVPSTRISSEVGQLASRLSSE